MPDNGSSLIEFLKDHRLESYFSTLEDNRVDLDVLPYLTADDLKEMNIPLGDRRRLLAAATSLTRNLATTKLRPRESGHVPERRQLTLMFCDLVGSTQLSERLEPEDLRDIMRMYLERTTSSVEKFGGHVAKIMGDGLLVYFGYPNAHEDDPERALLSALDCLQSITSSPIMIGDGSQIDLQARIGLHTGLVIVGNMDGVSSYGEDSIIGEAPNIAARLQSLAGPNEILVSPKTRLLAGDRFEYVALGSQTLKGISQPITPFRVVQEVKSTTRFEQRSGGILTPLVGRSREIEALVDLWKTAKTGAGQSAVLIGPAGIGKSRLSNTLVGAISSESSFVLKYQCSPHHTGTSLYPVIVQLNQMISALSHGGKISRQEIVKNLLRDTTHAPGKSQALVQALLSIESDNETELLDMSPRQQMEETLSVLIEQTLALSRERPLLILFEDAHWADPSTLNLMRLFMSEFASARVMLVTTFRETQTPVPVPFSDAKQFRLNRLNETEISRLAKQVAHPYVIAREIMDAIVQRADGVPLFAEELSKSLVEQMQGGGSVSDGSGAGAIFVPASLLDSLSARLDSLPKSKNLAQIAAAIGREFSKDLLYEVAASDTSSFDNALSELISAGILRPTGPETANRLIFSHALIQDVAYQLLLREDRRNIHQKIAQALERDHPEVVVQQPEVLAHHFEQATRIDKAVIYYLAASDLAIRRSANPEALRHLRHGLHLIKANSHIADAHKIELRLQTAIGTPLIAVEGYTSKETLHAFERAKEISNFIGDTQSRFRALFGLWGHRWMAGNLNQSLDLAAEMINLAKDGDVIERAIIAHRCMGSSHWIAGKFSHARQHLSRVIQLTDGMDTGELAKQYAICPRVVAHVLGGYGLWFEGNQTEAFEKVRAGFLLASKMKHAYSMALSHSILSGLHWLSEDLEQSKEHALALMEISNDRRFPYWSAYADTLLGSIMAKQGDCVEGIARIRASMDVFDKMGVKIQHSMQLVMLSDAEMRCGNTQTAIDLLDMAVAFGDHSGERQWFSIIGRQRRELVGAS